MLSALRSTFALAFASALVVLAMPGCSQQGVGEHCDYAKNGNEDCESGLTCVVKDSLLDRSGDRCCPAPGTTTDKRCQRGSSSGSGGSSSGGTTSGGSSGSGGTETGGTETGGAETGGTETGGTETGGTETGGTDAAGGAG